MTSDEYGVPPEPGGDASAARPPSNEADLEQWMYAVLRASHPLRVGSELRRAERAAMKLFPASRVASAVSRAVAAAMVHPER
jgi:hypothetical protein